MKKTFFTIVLISAFGSVFAQNLVVNGSFETETAANGSGLYQMNANAAPDGWTFTPSDANTDAFATTYFTPEDGAWTTEWGADGAGTVPTSQADYDTLSQTIATSAGATYNFSYWVQDLSGDTFYSNATWDGTVITGTQVSGDLASGSWVEYMGTVTGTGSDTLGVSGYDNPSYGLMDNVSLTQAVPEPLPVAVLGLGLLGLAIRRRR